MATYDARGNVREKTQPPQSTSIPKGAGTELKKLLARLHIVAKGGCGCNAMAAKMDASGTQWCRDNTEHILDAMSIAAEKRKLPFVRCVAYQIVRAAIRIAEKDKSTYGGA